MTILYLLLVQEEDLLLVQEEDLLLVQEEDLLLAQEEAAANAAATTRLSDRNEKACRNFTLENDLYSLCFP